MCTPMGTKLSAEFLEETYLFLIDAPKYFTDDNCKLIKELFKRYVDASFLPWCSIFDLNVFKIVSNNLHSTINFTVEPAKLDKISETFIIIFLNTRVLLHENGYMERNIFHKETNTIVMNIFIIRVVILTTQYSLKHNIPFNLAKCVLVFVPDEQQVALRLKGLRKCLLNCGYLESVIDK